MPKAVEDPTFNEAQIQKTIQETIASADTTFIIKDSALHTENEGRWMHTQPSQSAWYNEPIANDSF